jgi:hypothetical protein
MRVASDKGMASGLTVVFFFFELVDLALAERWAVVANPRADNDDSARTAARIVLLNPIAPDIAPQWFYLLSPFGLG